MSSPIGKFIKMAMTTGVLPKDAMNNVPPAIADYVAKWFIAKKFTTRLQEQERELAIMIVERNGELLQVPCTLQTGADGRDIINRELLHDGVNITGMAADLPLLEIMTAAIDGGDEVHTMQHLQDLLAQALENNRLQAAPQLPAPAEERKPVTFEEHVLQEDFEEEEEEFEEFEEEEDEEELDQ
jgi:hypothetical protein